MLDTLFAPLQYSIRSHIYTHTYILNAVTCLMQGQSSLCRLPHLMYLFFALENFESDADAGAWWRRCYCCGRVRVQLSGTSGYIKHVCFGEFYSKLSNFISAKPVLELFGQIIDRGRELWFVGLVFSLRRRVRRHSVAADSVV
jgi:hypothetical protein